MKKIFLLIAFFFTFSTIFSQTENSTSKYGKDSLKCITNLSVYVEFVKTGMYDYALDSWRYVFNNCPAASKNMYMHGVKIMKSIIKNEKDKQKKQKYIDTLLSIYDQRIEYFGQKGYVLGKKGIDVLKYRSSNMAEANELLKQSVELTHYKAEPSVLVQYLQTTSVLFKQNKLYKEDVINCYSDVSDILEWQLKNTTSPKKSEKIKKAINNIDLIFEKSNAANCESLMALFKPKYEADKTNVELLKKITKLLNKYECVENSLFYLTSESLYQIEPSAESAYMLAKMFLKKGDYNKSTSYYKEAIAKQTDSLDISRYYYELGILTHSQQSNPEQARTYAYKALKYNPTDGKPYILIGNIYAASVKNCGENDFERNAVYWVAVDKFITAKRVDVSLKADADKLISTYTKYFPGSEDTFFNGFAEGQDYTVGCWINETTKVRFE